MLVVLDSFFFGLVTIVICFAAASDSSHRRFSLRVLCGDQVSKPFMIDVKLSARVLLIVIALMVAVVIGANLGFLLLSICFLLYRLFMPPRSSALFL